MQRNHVYTYNQFIELAKNFKTITIPPFRHSKTYQINISPDALTPYGLNFLDRLKTLSVEEQLIVIGINAEYLVTVSQRNSQIYFFDLKRKRIDYWKKLVKANITPTDNDEKAPAILQATANHLAQVLKKQQQQKIYNRQSYDALRNAYENDFVKYLSFPVNEKRIRLDVSKETFTKMGLNFLDTLKTSDNEVLYVYGVEKKSEQNLLWLMHENGNAISFPELKSKDDLIHYGLTVTNEFEISKIAGEKFAGSLNEYILAKENEHIFSQFTFFSVGPQNNKYLKAHKDSGSIIEHKYLML